MSISSLVDSMGQIASGRSDPPTWFILLIIIFAAFAFLPGLRRWAARNFIAISAIVLSLAFVAGFVASFTLLDGGWPIVGMFVLVGAVIGLGNRGLVFVPHLDDGPRIGESTFSALTRIISIRIRRAIYGVTYSLFSVVGRMQPRRSSTYPYAAVSSVVRANPRSMDLSNRRPPISRDRRASPAVGARNAAAAILSIETYWMKKAFVAVAVVLVVTLGALLTFSGRTSGTLVEQPISQNVEGQGTAVSVLAADAGASVGFRVKNTDGQGVLLREQPGRNGKPVGSLMEGATVEAAGTDPVDADGITWREVKDVNGKRGWASSQFLDPVLTQGAVKISNTGGEGVLLRAKPGKIGTPIGLLHEGQEFRIAGPDFESDSKTWRNVTDEKGKSGWVSSEFLTPISR